SSSSSSSFSFSCSSSSSSSVLPPRVGPEQFREERRAGAMSGQGSRRRALHRAASSDRWLAEPLRGALDAVAEAEARCSRSSGYARLLAEPQRGLFLGGRLMDEARGASRSLEPNPVRQLEHDLDDLLDSARQAQEQLQALVAPSQGAWPPGQVAEKPEAFPMALFAYNPGVKPRAAAEVKALASYGPAEGGRRHRHLLDLARLSLVFGSCEMLQLGLDSVLRQFKVLGVRNLFRCPSRSLVWTRRVEARPATVQEGTKTLFPNPPWLGIRFE
ncbi:unnamed protein product, partial [Prorocentrum cordatum]